MPLLKLTLVADSVVLRAFGERSDSLHVVLSFYVGGEEAFREGWSSAYELIDPPWGDTVAVAVVDSFMRGRLDEVLRTVEVASIGSALSEGVDFVPSDQLVEDDAANMVASAFQYAAARIDWKRVPGDSVSAVIERVDQSPYDTAEVQAVMRDIRNHTRAGVMVSYGYETVMSLAWSNRARRFFVLWSCC